MEAILSWIYGLRVSQAIRTSHSMFTAIHVVHGVAIFFLVLLILKVDLRLIGIADKRTPVTEVLAETLPWTWGLFAIAAMTGLLMFVSKAPSFYDSEFFRLKIFSIGVAGINMALFHAFTLRGVAQWDSDVPPVFAAKVAGAFSLASWIAVIAFGFETLLTV